MATNLGKNGLPIGSGLYWNGSKIYCTVSLHDGRPALRFATGTDEWKKALLVRDAKIKALNTGELSENGRRVKIRELLDDYIADLKRKEQGRNDYAKSDSTSYKTASGIKHVRLAFDEMLAHKLDTPRLNKYVDDRLKEGAASSSIDREC